MLLYMFKVYKKIWSTIKIGNFSAKLKFLVHSYSIKVLLMKLKLNFNGQMTSKLYSAPAN